MQSPAPASPIVVFGPLEQTTDDTRMAAVQQRDKAYDTLGNGCGGTHALGSGAVIVSSASGKGETIGSD